jgi:uncharacterized protein
MDLLDIFANRILIIGLVAWGLAQIIKIPVEFILKRRWDWALLLRAGGMPSSHTALITSITHSIGLYIGFGSALYALSFVLAMIVIYDATGIRRQAGKHAAIINTIISDLAHGHPLRQEELREVLGHTPLEAITGMLFGLAIAQLAWYVWM